METVQAKDEAVCARVQPMQMFAALLKLLDQPAQAPQRAPGKHTRTGVTKNKMRGETKTRRQMVKKSRRINRRMR